MEMTIPISYEASDDKKTIVKWLSNLPKLCAFDFEASSKYSQEEKEVLKIKFELTNDRWERIKLLQLINSDGLSHPSLVDITHLSIAWSDRDAYVVICKDDAIRHLVYTFLVQTNITQLWHNGSGYDFRHIYYNANSLPKNFIDTMLKAKCVTNDANNYKGKVGLKDLMGWAYGTWALDKESNQESFTKENMYREKMLRYSATDACACFKLNEDIENDLDKWRL